MYVSISRGTDHADKWFFDSRGSGQHWEKAAFRFHEGDPDALVMVLTGNVHACKGKLPEIGPYPLMASFLPAAATVSLLVDLGGESWNCQGDGCGPHKLDSSGGSPREISLSATVAPFPGFDRVLATGRRATA